MFDTFCHSGDDVSCSQNARSSPTLQANVSMSVRCSRTAGDNVNMAHKRIATTYGTRSQTARPTNQ